MNNTTGCRVRKFQLAQDSELVTLENSSLSVSVWPEKGAEIVSLRYIRKDVEVLWKAPWEVKKPVKGLPIFPDSARVWLEHYGGGWQEIFPNAGDECVHKGIELSFHGEASLRPWSYEILEDSDQRASVRFSISLGRSPFQLTRVMTVSKGEPTLVLSESVENLADQTVEYIWGHHPAFGRPFLSGHCAVDSGARVIEADDRYDPESNFLPPAGEWSWPHVQDKDGKVVDIGRLPPADSGVSCLVYLKDFKEGWYAITNRELGFGVGFVWPKDVFQYAYYWIEANASPDFPFYGRAYTVAVEPFSSIPGQGLANIIEKTGTQLSLQPHGEMAFELRVVFYETNNGVRQISSKGIVEVK